MLSSSYKIPDGKLVKVKLTVASERIERITILGDFFLHPEETIETIETSLVGLEFDTRTLLSTIVEVMREAEATLIGAAAEDLVKAIMMAWDSR
ncbi:MAG: lipoate protein ligase C-terminal domain-containing protein [Candidatus Thorarchaeota archaeon]